MPSLIDWTTVKSKVDSYQEIYEYEQSTLALAHIVLEVLFSLSADEVEECLTDGSGDRGIDAVFIEPSSDREIVHLFQFKYVENFDRANKNFPGREIDKIISFIEDLLQRDESLKSTVNPILWGKVEEIWDAFDRQVPSFVVHLASNQGPLTTGERKRLEQSLRRHRTFSVSEHSLEDIANLLVEAKAPHITARIRLVDKQYFERVDGNIRGLVATVQATDLVEMIREEGNPEVVNRAIFEENVRVYLSSKNKINRNILASALAETNSEFWYLNNGITMTCESMEYPPSRAPILNMQGVQIVNGGQTSNALFEAARIDPDRLEGVLVLIRVYETRQKEISLKIAESTNSQTPIRSRDLRANDSVQRKLEESFRSLGYFYERKENQFKDKEKSRRIDAFVAGQAYVAYFMGNPRVAGKERGLIFGDLYDQVFSEDITAQALLASLRIYEPIRVKKRELDSAIRRGVHYDTDLLFLIDGSYHLLYAVGILCVIRGVDRNDVEESLGQLKDAYRVMAIAVEREKRDPAFAMKRFFKSARATSYLQEAAEGLQNRPKEKRVSKPKQGVRGAVRKGGAKKIGKPPRRK